MRRPPITRDDLLITWFCLIDDGLKSLWQGKRLLQREPASTLTVSRVITIEIVGEYLGLNTDTALLAFFRQHYHPFFPALRHLHRTTIVQQATSLYQLKERLWQW